MTNEIEPVDKTEGASANAIDISTVNGRTQIVFKKAILKGKVSSGDVLNTILIAARMQAEKYIEKLSRGAPLEVQEVKALKELAEITKLEIAQPAKQEGVIDSQALDTVKSTLYQALTDKLSSSKP
ncbi:MAG: hypothetical protein JWL77_6791 [Chthonomonadaceae bacterium]|nr:hypothetical protein [Chthonomonadaceae bacterium]